MLPVLALVYILLSPPIHCLAQLTNRRDADDDKAKAQHPYEVALSSGRIRGEVLSIGVDKYTVFKGIPYARPPVGKYRFKRVERPAPWRGVMNATQYKQACYQYRTSQQHKASRYERIRVKTPDFMNEDCLYLNVFSPPPWSNETFPVIVFFHPGGFQIGSATDFKQIPILKNFVARDVIFVTVNYRLGPFGFLTTRDSVLPGNNGLWDIILALKWVQRDIHAFGGDPDRVTLMGHGSGAAAASILSISPAAYGLFAQTILMSGTALTPGFVRDTAVNATWQLNKQLQCRAANSTALHACLEPVPPQDLMRYSRTFWDDYQEFVPMVDESEKLMPEPPEALASHRRKKPLLLGTTKDESALSLIILARQGVNVSVLDRAGAQFLVQNLTSSYAGFTNHKLITEGCIYEYVHTRTDPTMDAQVLKDGILEMYSHFWYNAPASSLASYYDRSHVPVYLYSFDHVSENLFVEDSDWVGSFHGSDLVLLFNTDFDFLRERQDKNWQLDRRVIEMFAEMLTNFVKTGQPTPPKECENCGLPFAWTPTSEKNLSYLSITDSPKMKVGYHWRGHVFWNWYARHLDAVDVGNLNKISNLEAALADYQMATWILLCAALFFLAILVGLAFYCTRKDAEEDDDI